MSVERRVRMSRADSQTIGASAMQGTVPPWAWVSPWERRARTRAAGERARRRDPDKYAFYGLRKDTRHFIRLDPLAKGLLLNRQWGATGAPVTWRVDRFHDTDPWAAADIKVQMKHIAPAPLYPVQSIQNIQSFRPYEPVSLVGGAGSTGSAGSATAAGSAAHGWSHAARGWAAGAVLLALLVIIVRAAENCLHKKLFKAIYMHTNVGAGEMQQDVLQGHYRLQGVRRQESDEWTTPNVMATSLQQHEYEARLSAPAQDVCCDLPPPYSECAAKRDEPPPPYSACYVTYTAPPASDTRHDTGDAAPRTQLVFDNGRIVERLSAVSSDSDAAAASAAPHSSRPELKDRVVYVDETADTAPPDRALLV
ncbi:uncharacterized protein LOC110380664 isoform X1 [Helicoverpa armigera]|uniref:uncharacterized protein LOC110380664 isoform X1 n=1 Tax=Helicoverpa armigera TaxID=29058 RepID=UPI0030830DB1